MTTEEDKENGAAATGEVSKMDTAGAVDRKSTTSELQSRRYILYAVFGSKKNIIATTTSISSTFTLLIHNAIPSYVIPIANILLTVQIKFTSPTIEEIPTT